MIDKSDFAIPFAIHNDWQMGFTKVNRGLSTGLSTDLSTTLPLSGCSS
ncbi:hypothetical protein [Pelosinus propionicus]|nr:hypothetical protein [Pelosinus propionicus]